MRKLWQPASILCSLLAVTPLVAADFTDEEVETFRDWINSKRMVTVKELGGQLSISGDVHAEMQLATVTKDGEKVRGGDGQDPLDEYDVEFNLNIDYRSDRTWAAARMRFDNDAGITTEPIGTGTNSKIKVDRAYFGYRVYDGDTHTTEVEVGRKPFYTVWDSRIQFGTNFDGVSIKDSYAFERAGDFYYSLGTFLINEKKDQFAYGGETGLVNIGRTGFYVKYSLVNWDTKHIDPNNAKGLKYQFEFLNSQMILGYKFIPTKWDKLVHFYVAGLHNHRADPHRGNAKNPGISDYKRQNYAGYAGISLGQVKQSGDWAFETNYQVVQAQAIPSFDVLGIGLGSSSKESFYYSYPKDSKDSSKDSKDPKPNKQETAQGNVNYQGFMVSLQYMLTNNLNVFQEWKQASTLNTNIGPDRRFKQYELDLIYSF